MRRRDAERNGASTGALVGAVRLPVAPPLPPAALVTLLLAAALLGARAAMLRALRVVVVPTQDSLFVGDVERKPRSGEFVL